MGAYIALSLVACARNSVVPLVTPSVVSSTGEITLPSAELPTRSATAQAVTRTPIPSFMPIDLPPTQTQTPRPTAVLVTWLATAVEIPIRFQTFFTYRHPETGDYLPCDQIEWLDALIVSLYQQDCKPVVMSADSGIVSTVTPMPTALNSPTPFNWDQSYSPHNKFRLDCTDEEIRLFRAKSEVPIGTFTVSDPFCSSASWEKQETAVAFVTMDGSSAYVWRVDQAQPYRLGTSWSVKWSPDSKRLLLVTGEVIDETAQAWIVDRQGNVLNKFPIILGGATWDVDQIAWVSNHVIVEPLGSSEWVGRSYYFYDTVSGQSLGSWCDSVDYPRCQPPFHSPNGRWQAINGFEISETGKYLDTYWMDNLETGQVYTLTQTTDQYLDFVGWSADSRLFYFASRPVTETQTVAVDVPFGLLAFDVASQQFKLLLQDVVFSQLSPDRKFMWVVSPTMQSNSPPGLQGQILNLSNGQLTAAHVVSNHVIYSDPITDLIPSAWSPNSRRLVFINERGEVVLVERDGASRLLATGIASESWPEQRRLFWSPDSQRVLVQVVPFAWVVKP